MRVSFTTTLLCAALPLLAFAGRAQATPTRYTLSYLPGGEVASLAHGYENVTINDTSANLSEGGAAGPVTLDVHGFAPGGGTTPLELLCTDIFDTYVSGGTYTLGRLSDTLSDAVKVSQIAALLENGLTGATTNATAAALQVAVWEVENETSETGYNVTMGDFHVTGYGGGLDETMAADANADLLNVEDGVWKASPREVVMQFEPIAGSPDQSFAYIAAVPEPAGITLLGFGALAAAGMRRHRA